MGRATGEDLGCVVAHPKGCGTEGEIGVRYGGGFGMRCSAP